MSKQKGAAIIIALAIVSFAVVIAISLALLIKQQTNSLSEIKNNLQIKQYENSLIKQAEALLKNDVIQVDKSKEVIDKLPANLSLSIPGNTIKVRGYLLDAQGYFNINNLISQQWQNVFYQLLQYTNNDIQQDDAKIITQSILSQLSKDEFNPQFYLQSTQLFTQNILSQKQFDKIDSWLIAMPKPTKINVNALTPEILASLGDGLSLEDASKFLSKNKRFNSLQEFLSENTIRSANISSELITTQSNYFLLNIFIETAPHQQRFMQVLLYRVQQDDGKDPIVTVLWQRGG